MKGDRHIFMVHKIAVRISESLINNGMSNRDNVEYYIYGIEVFIEKITFYLIVLSLALYFRLFIPSILFLVFFIALRGRTGGYHAKRYISCLLGSTLLFLSCCKVFAPFLLNNTLIMYLLCAIASVIILIFAPVNHPNVNMDSEELNSYRIRARVVLGLELLYIVTLSILRIKSVYIIFPSMGIIMCAVLLMIAKIIKQEVSYERRFD
ncbi:accessory gene regulator B family protein [Lachnospiraceae bacterium MD1]|uniref:Accessory gene regulator B family protein n=1 Tax=Variimorphobacter saccharofermentans TaxID=2755051 RepID=A0A839JYW0_9FIRM|nr:accessory gene regulator B family protein [Variimorphobacter saccharofermentans]MBB2182863.1 accessory gene regulator B family protein [Variimorphobacter saccharofermentans]